jgi:predicted dehydrogenase
MILLVGYGYWGKNLARNFGKNLTAVCDSDQSQLEQAKILYPHIKVYTKIEDALSNSDIKMVAIATKAETHFNLASMCLFSDKDLWIEKPICDNIEDIKRLQNLAIKKDKIIFIDHTFCYHPAVQKMKEINIGTPLYYDSLRISLGLFQPDVDVLLDLAVHDVSILNFLYPDLELKERQIIKNTHINDKANQSIINLKFKNNFTANINVNWVSPVKKRQIILAGKECSIVYDDLENDKLKVYNTGTIDKDFNFSKLGEMTSPKINTNEALKNATDHFIDCCTKRVRPLTDITNSTKIMEWLL